MAITVTQDLAGGDKSAGTTTTISAGEDYAVDDVIVIFIAVDNAGTNGASPYSSVGSPTSGAITWETAQVVTRDVGAANEGVTLVALVGKFTSAATGTFNIVVTWSTSVTAKAYLVYKLEGAEVAWTGNLNTNNTNSSPVLGDAGVVSGELVLGAVAVESNTSITTGDSDTTNGSWSTAWTSGSAGGGNDATKVSVGSQYKIATASGLQTWQPTVTNTEWACRFFRFEPVPTGPTEHEATMTGAWGALSGTASATTTRAATLAGSWGTLTGAATVQPPAVLAGAWGALSGTATATPGHTATLAGSWGALSGSMIAGRLVEATLSGSWGALSGAITATPDHPAVLAGAWGALSASATATPDHPATLSGAWGALTGTASFTSAVFAAALGGLAGALTATPDHPATLTGAWGALSSTSSATVTHGAVLAGAWGALAGAATAGTEIAAVLDGPFGAMSATATATPDHPATLAGAWGALTGTADATVTPGGGGGSEVFADLSASFGALGSSATATPDHSATLTGAWGALTAATADNTVRLHGTPTLVEDTDGTAAAGTLDVDKPAGGADGDVYLVIAHAAREGSFPIVTGTGFSVRATGQNDNSTPDWRIRALTKAHVGDEGSTFTFTTSNVLVYWALAGLLVRGANPDNPINATASSSEQSGTSLAFPQAITDADNCGLFFVVGVSGGSITTTDPGNGWTEVASFLDDSVKVFHTPHPTAGLSPEGTIEASESTDFFGFVLAFNPGEPGVIVTHDASLTGNWGALTAAASITVDHGAVLAGAWGALSGTAAAGPQIDATLAGAWGQLACAIDDVTVEHAATFGGTWGALAGDADAGVERTASLELEIGWHPNLRATVERSASFSTAWGLACELEAEVTPSARLVAVWTVDDFHMQGPGRRRRRHGKPKTPLEAMTMRPIGLRDREGRTRVQHRTRGV